MLGAGYSDSGPTLLAVVTALAFFASILLHELGHAVVAIRNGIPISDITLWLFGGVARMARDTDSPGTEFKVAVAGPVVTLACRSPARGRDRGRRARRVLERDAGRRDADISRALAVLAWLASINVLVLIFNLIPAFPLDGGRIARAIVWRVTGDRNRATSSPPALGQGFSYLFMAVGLLLVVNGDASVESGSG